MKRGDRVRVSWCQGRGVRGDPVRHGVEEGVVAHLLCVRHIPLIAVDMDNGGRIFILEENAEPAVPMEKQRKMP